MRYFLLFFIWVFIDLYLLTASENNECVIAKTDDRRGKYNGTISITNTGKTCIHWRNTGHPEYGLENYCRAPSAEPESAKGPWCYVNVTPWLEHCDIPICENNECVIVKPHNWRGKYNGTTNITNTGKTCIYWVNTNHPSYGPANYCRAPPEDPDSAKGPWCYINGPRLWEYCDIPFCGNINNGTTCYKNPLWSTLNVDINNDKLTYNYNERVVLNCKRGFTGRDVTTTCIGVNTWSAISNTCSKITCSKNALWSNLNVDINMDKATYNYNDRVVLTCKRGFTGRDVTTTCTDVNTWSDVSPTCSRITCDKNHVWSTLNVDINNDKSTYNYNDRVLLSCQSGFTGGNVTTTCTGVNTWSDVSHTCSIKLLQCSKNHLWFTLNVDINNDKPVYNYNERVVLTCKLGYTGRSETTICQGVNTWSVISPTCLNTSKYFSSEFTSDTYDKTTTNEDLNTIYKDNIGTNKGTLEWQILAIISMGLCVVLLCAIVIISTLYCRQKQMSKSQLSHMSSQVQLQKDQQGCYDNITHVEMERTQRKENHEVSLSVHPTAVLETDPSLLTAYQESQDNPYQDLIETRQDSDHIYTT